MAHSLSSNRQRVPGDFGHVELRGTVSHALQARTLRTDWLVRFDLGPTPTLAPPQTLRFCELIAQSVMDVGIAGVDGVMHAEYTFRTEANGDEWHLCLTFSRGFG